MNLKLSPFRPRPQVHHEPTRLVRAHVPAPSAKARQVSDGFDASPVRSVAPVALAGPSPTKLLKAQLENSARNGLLSSAQKEELALALSSEGPTAALQARLDAQVDAALADPTARIVNLSERLARGGLSPLELASAQRELRCLQRTLVAAQELP